MYSKNFELNTATHRQLSPINEVQSFAVDVLNHKIGQSHQVQSHHNFSEQPHQLHSFQPQQLQQQHHCFHASHLMQNNQEHTSQQPQQQTNNQHQLQQHRQTQSKLPSHSTLFNKFDVSKSTKGASKLRRDLINAEISNLRDLLPLPVSTRQRLSQLQLMALVCVYVRKANYFQQVFSRHDITLQQNIHSASIGFSKALSGFLMMLTQNGKLLYISDNATEYLGHSMEDLLIHGDSVYDIIDKQDHTVVQAELNRNANQDGQEVNMSVPTISSIDGDRRIFLCRINVTRNVRRQMRFGDQKVVLIQGRYLSFLPLCSRNEPVFLATCTPIAMPETRECVVQGATNVFTTIHAMDMKIMHIDKNGEFHLGYTRNEIQGISWYALLHGDNLREAQCKHKLLVQSEQDRACILLVRLQRHSSEFIWVHVVLQVRDGQDSNQQPVIVCTNQVLNECEASVMRINSWLYHFYSMQSKIQFELSYENSQIVPTTTEIRNSTPIYYHNLHYPTSSVKNIIECREIPSNFIQAASVAENAHRHQHNIQNLQPDNAHCSLMHISNLVTATSGLVNETKLVKIDDPLYRSKNMKFQSQLLTIESHPRPKFNLQAKVFHEPFDYSQLTYKHQTISSTYPASSNKPNGIDSLFESTNSSESSYTSGRNKYLLENNFTCNNCISSSSLKRKLNEELDTLYALGNPTEQAICSIDEIDKYQCHSNQAISLSHGSHSSVIVATLLPGRSCSSSHLLNKIFSADPTEYIDQWNLSPPWSDSAQKHSLDISSISQQELSPCTTTTPPTPTGGQLNNNAAGVQTIGSTFSFEWMPEQLKPMVDTCVTHQCSEPLPVFMTHTCAHSHSHSHYTQRTPTWAAHVISPNHYNNLTQHLNSQNHRYISITETLQNQPQKTRASATVLNISHDEYKKDGTQ